MKEAVIFSMEEFAIHDGPGIRTTIFLKGCPLRCAWCHNPEGISPEPEYMTKKGERTLCGTKVTSGELAEQILKNRAVFEMNRGGITLTGGEPLMQHEFVTDLLEHIPAIHTAIETSGYSSEKAFKSVLPLVDLVLFDLKQMDPAQHKKYTGADNAPILRNLHTLCESDKEFVIRIPLIPGVNDTEENMHAVAEAVKGAPNLQRVELMRYHKTAGAKYPMIGQAYSPPFDTDATPCLHTAPFNDNNIKTIIL